MASRKEELERFKRDIDLRLFAAEFGFQIDARESSPSGTVMRGPGDAKIRISKDGQNQFVYWNAHDPADKGTIIQFVQYRTCDNLGELRKRLRPWLGVSGVAPVSRVNPLPPLQPARADIEAVQARFAAMRPLEGGQHSYLNRDRSLPAPLLASPRFADRIRVDERTNAIFPHFNRAGVCGWEAKNHAFTGFSPRGVKGLWVSRIEAGDTALIFAESAIDAISYAAVKPDPHARYVSIAGQVSDEQVGLAVGAIQRLRSGTVVLAFDQDAAGGQLVERFRAVFREARRTDLRLRVDQPEAGDWNDAARDL